MADRRALADMASKIQSAVQQLQDGDASSRAAVGAAAIKLERMLESSAEAILRQRFHTVENLCVIAAEEMGLLDLLSSMEEDTSKTASDLAAASGYDQTMIIRIMRVITAIGFADEIDYQQYKPNEVTRLQNTAGARGGFVLTNDFLFASAGQIRDYFRQLKPCKPGETPAPYDFATYESIWNTLRENVEWKTGLDNAMRSRQKLFSMPWHDKFPLIKHLATEASSRDNQSYVPTIVDIGGNQGVDLQRIIDAYPELKCRLVLQDLPETINAIAPGSLSDRIEQTCYDFFTVQPICGQKGASIYYLKSVLHDWDDNSSRKILSHTAKAMDENSRLLINDIVLADTNEVVDRADMDALMFFISNGMERSRSQWDELLASTLPPLEILKIWTLPEDPQSVIEAQLVKQKG